MNLDNYSKALFSLAEEFRTKSPPDLKATFQCLHAILNLPVSAQITAKINYHLGSMIYKYTYDTNIAQTYLERAYEQSQTIDLTLNRLKVVAPLVEIYLTQNQRQLAKQFLSRAINDTTTSGGGFYNLYWHYRYLLKLSRLNVEDKDFATALNLLSIGAQTAGATNDSTTKVLFLLSKCLVLMIATKYSNLNLPNQQPQMLANLEQQLTETSTTAGNLIENLQATDPTYKESMRLFLLVLQVCRLLNKGHNKTAKPCLKSLQQTMHNLTSSNGPLTSQNANDTNMSENFIWMSKDHMFLLVYLISVLYSMQAGFLDKAQNYTERALVQVENLRSQSQEPDTLLESFHVILLEHMSMCYLVMGNRASAIKQMVHAIQLCFGTNSKLVPSLRIRHRGIIHTLLGFYSMSMSMIEEAENHFNCVIESSDVAEEFRFMARVNLALCWLQQDNDRRNQKRDRIEGLLKKVVEEEAKNSLSYCQQAAFNYVLGLKAFCDESFTQAKKNLRETLKIANGEDLNRITSCSLVLLGKIFNNSNSPQSSLNMVSPALKLAGRIPDLHLQLWAASMLRDIYSENQESPHYIDAANMHANINTLLDNDKMVCMNLPEHYNYVQWDLTPQ